MEISWLLCVPLGLTIASSVWAEDLPGVNRLFSDHMVGSKTGMEPVKEVSDGKLRRFAIAAKDGSVPTGLKCDLGPGVAKNLEAANGLMGGLHPNDRGHANFAAAIIP